MKMLSQISCLKAGGLALGALGAMVAVFNVFLAIAVQKNFADIDHNFVMASIIGDAPEHIIRIAYATISIFDLIFSALLIAGILLKRKLMLLPWIVSSLLEIVITAMELSSHLIPAIIIVSIFGGIIYVWYSICALYRQMSEEEKASSGVQLAYVNESSSQLPPYNVLTIDK